MNEHKMTGGEVARETLQSRLGFLLLAAGCAVGLGNVWRFPFVVGRNGGAAFLVVYLICLALLGFPLLTAELTLGRAARQGVAGALSCLAPERMRRFWTILGGLIFLGNLLLMMYYTTVGGWLLRYAAGYICDGPAFVGAAPQATFAAMTSSPGLSAGFMLVCTVLAGGVCACGLCAGVERVTKWMMLALLALLGVLAVKALTLPGASAGVSFYLKPDWGPFWAHPFRTCFEAMGQAFFTLSTGVGCMTIFGSYVDRSRTLAGEALWIIGIDTCVALLSGLIVFPACASFGVSANAGPGLIFVALPNVFAQMAGGRIWGAVFFFFLSLAALTTVIAVFECLIGGLMDRSRRSRRFWSVVVSAAVAVLSLPTVLGFNVWKKIQILPGKTILDFEDYLFSQFWLPLGALAICLFCVWPCGMNWPVFQKEANTGTGPDLPVLLKGYMRWGLPVVLLVILIAGL
jgi:NSS family neurotransmitter:Na+ symporter